jgi:hypothetical protein
MNVQTVSKDLADIVGASFVQDTLKKLAIIELERYSLKMKKLRAELAHFEKGFQKSSEATWEEFKSGKLGDDADLMEWMMLFENYQELKKRYEKIKGVKFE